MITHVEVRKRKTRRTLITEINEGLKMVRRPQGATTKEMEYVMNRASIDCPEFLRRYLKRHLSKLELVSERLGKLSMRHGNCRLYRIRERIVP